MQQYKQKKKKKTTNHNLQPLKCFLSFKIIKSLGWKLFFLKIYMGLEVLTTMKK